MKNALANHDRIASVIEDAVVRGSGYAASAAASTIDKEFILIAKSDLPTFATASSITGYNRTIGSQTYWSTVLDYIATALHAEQEEAEHTERKLAGMRKEAWKMLHPLEASWDYNTQTPSSKKQVDVVVNLMRQVDELKESK